MFLKRRKEGTKFQTKEGPYQVVEVVSSNNVKLKTPNKTILVATSDCTLFNGVEGRWGDVEYMHVGDMHMQASSAVTQERDRLVGEEQETDSKSLSN